MFFYVVDLTRAGPNCLSGGSDDLAGCGDIQTSVGGSAELIRMGMPCYAGDGSWPNRQAAPRSMHLGGIFTCFCDGSVHWISNNILPILA